MAAYREHILVSGGVGLCIGGAAVYGLGFSPAQGALAACLAWVAGMAPDVDSSSGRPIRELFSLLAAATPLLLLQRIVELTSSFDQAVLAAFLLYGLVRYGGAALVAKLSVHRGMFHSIPAALIASLCTFMAYKGDSMAVKGLMAASVGAGYLSHLLLDELYSVSWSGASIELNQFAGSAVKLFGSRALPNIVTYSLLAGVGYFSLVQLELVEPVGLNQMAQAFGW